MTRGTENKKSSVLELVPHLSPSLFHLERLLSISQMDHFKKYIGEYNIPIPISLLRISALSYFFYHAPYSTLAQISFLFLFNKQTKNLFFVSQLFFIGGQLALNLYNALPTTAFERDIAAPGAFFQWTAMMIKEFIKLPIYIIGINIFFFLTKIFSDQKKWGKPNNQAGFYSIAFFLTQFTMLFVDGQLFEFDYWKSAQHAETELLQMANRDCKAPCELTIETSIFSRIWQQLISAEQKINIVAKQTDVTTECELIISAVNNTCFTYQPKCTSRLFQATGSQDANTKFALVVPKTYTHPIQQYVSCLPLRKYILNGETRFSHYIETNQLLNEAELKILSQLISSFPHASNKKNWPTAFQAVDLSGIPEKLLTLAANAYDDVENTVLGVAAEYGYDLAAVKKLVEAGADINKPGHLHNKLPIHWAIDNKFSFHHPTSTEALAVLEFLIDHGADITLPRDRGDGSPLSALEYAIQRKYPAAAELLRKKMAQYIGYNADNRCDPDDAEPACQFKLA